MGNQWEAHVATIIFGKPVTRKTVDVFVPGKDTRAVRIMQ